jgi:putative transposase
VRGYEVDQVGALWHLDFHTSKRIAVLRADGSWIKPQLLAVMDDRSRLCCHAQFYCDETTETLCHGFWQALLKYGLPRKLMSDNGSAMTAAEFTTGLERCSILHQRTLVYSPYQNGKQETFWATVEGSLLAMLEQVHDLSLKQLNTFTQAWINQEYHQQPHREIGTTPQRRYLEGPSVLRPKVPLEHLRDRFRERFWRQSRRFDGIFSLKPGFPRWPCRTTNRVI